MCRDCKHADRRECKWNFYCKIITYYLLLSISICNLNKPKWISPNERSIPTNGHRSLMPVQSVLCASISSKFVLFLVFIFFFFFFHFQVSCLQSAHYMDNGHFRLLLLFPNLLKSTLFFCKNKVFFSHPGTKKPYSINIHTKYKIIFKNQEY